MIISSATLASVLCKYIYDIVKGFHDRKNKYIRIEIYDLPIKHDLDREKGFAISFINTTGGYCRLGNPEILYRSDNKEIWYVARLSDLIRLHDRDFKLKHDEKRDIKITNEMLDSLLKMKPDKKIKIRITDGIGRQHTKTYKLRNI